MLGQSSTQLPVLDQLSLPLDRDTFLRTLVRELAGTLQDVVGLEEASGFVSVVGQRIGEQLNASYLRALGVTQLTPSQVAAVMVDLKRRIRGEFFIIEENEDKIVLGNRSCPFAEKVIGRPALCMMTSNVFGTVAAENLGYAKVVIDESIALGATGCRVTVYLNPDSSDTPPSVGREYYKT